MNTINIHNVSHYYYTRYYIIIWSIFKKWGGENAFVYVFISANEFLNHSEI